MDIKLIVIERAVKWLVGGDLFAFVQEAVREVNDHNLSGEEKREAVQIMAKELFNNFGVVFINLAIEVAVLLLTAELSEEV